MITDFDKSFVKPNNTTLLNALYYNGYVIGYILQDNSNNVWIVFRGTETTKEWLQDFGMGQKTKKIPQVQLTFGGNQNLRCHQGFLHIYSIFRNKLLKTLKAVNNIENIIITGHSLGSGLATLATIDISTKYNNIYTYVFASPRVGNPELSKNNFKYRTGQ